MIDHAALDRAVRSNPEIMFWVKGGRAPPQRIIREQQSEVIAAYHRERSASSQQPANGEVR